MAFLRDTSSSQPFLRAPAVVVWLILALVGAHALRVWVFPEDSNWLFVQYGFVPARYSHAYLAAHAYMAGQLPNPVLPFISYMFLHGSWTHVAVNCVWLLPFGPVVARRFGSLQFLIFFLLCGVAGAATHLACNWGSPAPVIGASAAVSGLMAASFRMLPAGPGEPWRRLEPIFSRRTLIWTAIWIAVNVVAGVTRLGTGNDVDVVAWQAHIGGYFAGLLLAGLFDRLAGPHATLPSQA